MIRAALEMAVLGFFVSVVIAWCDRGAEIVTLIRMGGQ